MTRTGMMRRRRESPAVDLIRLIKKIDNYDTNLICVFEGNDAAFYGARIDIVFPDFLRKSLSCRSKKKVLDLRDSISKNLELQKAKIIYFVDKDFEERIEGANLYCTPTYSIENLYVNENVFRKVLTDELGLCAFEDARLVDRLIDWYARIESEADTALLALNAWIMVRVEESKTNPAVRLNLNNYEIDEFISIDSESVIKNYDLPHLDAIFSIDEEIDEVDFQTCSERLDSLNPRQQCRGKYRLQFFRKILLLVIKDAASGEGLFEGRVVRSKLSLSKNQVVSELSQYADTPGCLMDFLKGYRLVACC